MKRFLLAILLAAALCAGCAAGGQAPVPEPSVAPEPESPSSVSEPAPEPPSSSEAPEESSRPEEPVSEPEPSSAPKEPSSSSPEPEEIPPEEQVELLTTPPPEERVLLGDYLVEHLTKEEYTNFYYVEGDGLGILTPNIARVKEMVSSYGTVSVPVEYREVPYSRAYLNAAKDALRSLERSFEQTDDPIYINVFEYGSSFEDTYRTGLLYIYYHTLHPALKEFLETSEYKECFRLVYVENEMDGSPNPDT